MSEPRTEQLVVSPDEAGTRIDALLTRRLGLSRVQAALLCTEGNVTLAGKALGKSRKTPAGATIEVFIPLRPDPLEIRVNRGRSQDHC